MTLQRTAASVQMFIDPPPMTDIPAVRETREWAAAMFQRLLELQQQPRIQGLMFGRLEIPTDAGLAKPGDGMMVWAFNDAVGPGKAEGLYFRMGGVWREVKLV